MVNNYSLHRPKSKLLYLTRTTKTLIRMEISVKTARGKDQLRVPWTLPLISLILLLIQVLPSISNKGKLCISSWEAILSVSNVGLRFMRRNKRRGMFLSLMLPPNRIKLRIISQQLIWSISDLSSLIINKVEVINGKISIKLSKTVSPLRNLDLQPVTHTLLIRRKLNQLYLYLEKRKIRKILKVFWIIHKQLNRTLKDRKWLRKVERMRKQLSLYLVSLQK